MTRRTLSLSLSLSLSQSFHHSLPMEKGVVLLTKETEREGERVNFDDGKFCYQELF